MKVIRIDDEVWKVLQKRAVPLQDTPNTVLRRILRLDVAMEENVGGKQSGRRRRKRRLRPGAGRTPQNAFIRPILQILDETKGEARMAEVLSHLESKMKGQLTSIDFERLSTGQTRWKNTAQWARSELVSQGLLAHNSPRGIWRITDKGKKFIEDAR